MTPVRRLSVARTIAAALVVAALVMLAAFALLQATVTKTNKVIENTGDSALTTPRTSGATPSSGDVDTPYGDGAVGSVAASVDASGPTADVVRNGSSTASTGSLQEPAPSTPKSSQPPAASTDQCPVGLPQATQGGESSVLPSSSASACLEDLESLLLGASASTEGPSNQDFVP